MEGDMEDREVDISKNMRMLVDLVDAGDHLVVILLVDTVVAMEGEEQFVVEEVGVDGLVEVY
jgi:hypothetical protein